MRQVGIIGKPTSLEMETMLKLQNTLALGKGQFGSPFFNYFVTIDDLYNGAKIVNLTLVVVEV